MAGCVDRFSQTLPFLMCLLYMVGFNGFGIEEKPLSQKLSTIKQIIQFCTVCLVDLNTKLANRYTQLLVLNFDALACEGFGPDK